MYLVLDGLIAPARGQILCHVKVDSEKELRLQSGKSPRRARVACLSYSGVATVICYADIEAEIELIASYPPSYSPSEDFLISTSITHSTCRV